MTGPGFILGPGPAGRWDDVALSCPVVRREGGHWRMWYYGRDRAFPGGGIEADGDGVPMGRSGLATSVDGVSWDRVNGSEALGSVLAPSADPERFDGWQVGGTDIIVTNGEYRYYYQGARDAVMTIQGRRMRGFPLVTGLAISPDGVTFTKVDGAAGRGAVLANGAPGEWDEWFAGWARVLPVAGGFRMYYHGGGSTTPPSMGIAESADGIHWEKRGIAFGPNPDTNAFDTRSINTRHILPYQDGYLMAYEALPAEAGVTYRIGLATSMDGLEWERCPGPGPKGCVLDVGGAGSWDAIAIGTPYLVPQGDGSIWMYYVGFSETGQSSIGLAICDGSDLTRWTRHG